LKNQYEQQFLVAKTIYDRKIGGIKPPKKKKDPNAPKPPLSAYFLFSAEERNKIKEDMPDISMCEVAKELGQRWADLDPTIKQKFQVLAQEGREKYDVDMAVYRQEVSQHSLEHTNASVENKQAELQQSYPVAVENKHMKFQPSEGIKKVRFCMDS